MIFDQMLMKTTGQAWKEIKKENLLKNMKQKRTICSTLRKKWARNEKITTLFFKENEFVGFFLDTRTTRKRVVEMENPHEYYKT